MSYVHYGESFSKDKFEPIKNTTFGLKPIGGFWGSMPTSEKNWKNWCLKEGFRTDTLSQEHFFNLTPEARILTLRSPSDLEPLPKRSGSFLNYEKIGQEYDAIEYYTTCNAPSMYSWDCDCILILNPYVIQKI